jgi:hypothetical protein
MVIIFVCVFVLWMLYVIVSEFNINVYAKIVNNKLSDKTYNYTKSVHLTHGVALEVI